ncbi:hypothetical protein [Planctomycetes bacterium K23_9]|uniref:Uncharacterized protein n=1 Tax=Stieleria marina TaxID=1930275 RepID=A0A517NQE3_9BACT|nr:hypothetical protein K239x_12920 [Planctomycetes bacterium K23_9]
MKSVVRQAGLVVFLMFLIPCTTVSAQLSGIGQVLERANQTASSVAGTKSLEEFRTWVNAYVANPQGDVLVPLKWFDEHFDAETARALKTEYRQAASMYSGIGNLVAKQKAQGKTNLELAMHTKAIDPTATGWQNAALQRMTKPTPLYSLRMVRPGATSGFSLVSFVYVDGRFAFAGKLSALHDPQDDLATKILCTTAIEKMEKVLQEKGLIKSSAVEHLKQAGVLK